MDIETTVKPGTSKYIEYGFQEALISNDLPQPIVVRLCLSARSIRIVIKENEED